MQESAEYLIARSALEDRFRAGEIPKEEIWAHRENLNRRYAKPAWINRGWVEFIGIAIAGLAMVWAKGKI